MDGRLVVVNMDNQYNISTKFTFKQTIGNNLYDLSNIIIYFNISPGTKWTYQTSESKSIISAQVEATLKASFWELFETRVGFSKTTGYAWGRVDSYTKSDVKSFTISLKNSPL